MRATLPLLIAVPLLLCSGCEESTPQVPPPTIQLAATPYYNGANAYAHCNYLCSLGPRPSASPAYGQQLAYLSKHLQAAGWQVKEEPFSLSNGMKMVNLHATFGNTQDTRRILISCHIDTKIGISENFVGADDGASAAAAMLELARILAATPQKAAAVELVFFDGEEAFARNMTEQDGLYGSRYDVMRRGENGLPCYQINLDMVGGRNKTIAIPLADTSDEMLAVYEEVIADLKLSPRRWTGHPGGYLDDHLPFERAGVQTLNLIAQFTGSSWWHTERDNMERICPQSLRETGDVVLALLDRLLDKAE